jgi:hypothetical protein
MSDQRVLTAELERHEARDHRQQVEAQGEAVLAELQRIRFRTGVIMWFLIGPLVLVAIAAAIAFVLAVAGVFA